MAKLHYIPEIMLLKGISNVELAKKIGVVPSTLNKRIANDLRMSTAQQIAKALDVPLLELFIDPDIKHVFVDCPECGVELGISIKQQCQRSGNADKVHYIKEIMRLKGVTNTELAKRLGVSQQAVSIQIAHDLRVSSAYKIAEALEVSLSELFINPHTSIKTQTEKRHTATVECPKCGTDLEISVTQK